MNCSLRLAPTMINHLTSNIGKEMNNIALHLYMVNTVIINNTVYEIDHNCNVHA